MPSTTPDRLPREAIPDGLQEFAVAVREGLLKPRGKTLPCRFFYDERGSQIFEKVCEVPEYYPTRCETAIIEKRSHEITLDCAGHVAVVELGSGNAMKTRIILTALLERDLPITYVPIDISVEALHAAASALQLEYPMLTVRPIAGEYEAGLQQFDHKSYDTILLLWLGTSIGNLEPQQAEALLEKLRHACGPGGSVLLGADLKKEKSILQSAYDDPQGITAQFNLNILARINRELGGRFDLSQFQHKAFYDERAGRIEMHILSRRKQNVAIDKIGISVDFEAGESIHTENSYKFSFEELQELCRRSGMHLMHHWLDADSLFSVNLLRA